MPQPQMTPMVPLLKGESWSEWRDLATRVNYGTYRKIDFIYLWWLLFCQSFIQH